VDFEQVLAYLSSLETRGWRLGLDRMEEFIRRAGLEEAIEGNSPRFIHVAGTNGKGSVTAYVQAVLTASGYRTGSFFSPFVYDLRERVQLDGKPIPREDFARIGTKLAEAAETLTATELGGVTEFEFKTALGFAYWQEARADWVALEVGLGGRLDATNVVAPACSVIVSIGMDHTEFLGHSLAEIASEKAGILKPGRPGVVGELQPEALEAVRKIAREKDCPLWVYGEDFAAEKGGDGWIVRTPLRAVGPMQPPLPGSHQAHNMAVAVAAVDAAKAAAPDRAILEGLAQVRLPGRFERRTAGGVEAILDGAHNAPAMKALAQTLEGKYPGEKFEVVFGMLQGHDPEAVVRIVERFAARVHLCPIGFRRTRQTSELAPLFRVPVHEHPGSEQAIRAAMAAAKAGGRKVLATGSFYLVGEVGNWLSNSAQ
jgi:dihydrofolate synthase/folylpolyglutamate synthase